MLKTSATTIIMLFHDQYTPLLVNFNGTFDDIIK